MSEAVVVRPPEIYISSKATPAGSPERRAKVALNIIGRSGCGKSHTIFQCASDPQYGPDEILVAMAENSTASYGPVMPAIEDVGSFGDVRALVADLVTAHRKGKRLPKLLFLDDLSILSQKERRYYDENPITSEGGNRDTRTEFRLKGYGLIDALMDIRTDLPIDSVIFIRAHEGPWNAAPEIALEGNIAPKNLTGMSSTTLYMKSESPKTDPATFLDVFKRGLLFQPHRTLSMTAEEIEAALKYAAKSGEPPQLDTMMINRFFVTMNTGEIEAKGHHALRLKEKAYLPGILRKIHHEKPLTPWG
jgi:hypothetical protein